MGAVMKALVAVACVCVIAVSTHYGYLAYSAHVAEQQRAADERNEALAVLQRAKDRMRVILDEENKREEAERAARKKERIEKGRRS